jgi:hypothetical protein
MNKLVANVGVMAIAVGALTKGLETVYAHDYITGGIAVIVGIALLVLYEKLPITPQA